MRGRSWRDGACSRHTQVRLAGVLPEPAGVGELRHLGLEPGEAVPADELGHHQVVDARQVEHVVDRIAQLLGVEGAPRPVREPVGLVEVDAQVVLDEGTEAHLHALSQEGRGELGVEDGRHDAAARVVDDLEVLVAGVEDLRDGRVGQDLHEGREVRDRLRVYRRRLVCGRDLDEAQLGMVALLAQELGVDRDHLVGTQALAEAREPVGC